MDEVRKVFIKPLIMLQNILENESEADVITIFSVHSVQFISVAQSCLTF